MGPLVVEHELVGGRCVVAVAGDVDAYTYTDFRQYLRDRIAEGHHHLVVDLERASLWESTGLGVLVGALKRLRAVDGSLNVVLADPKKLKIFTLTGMTKVFPIHPSVDAVPACEG